LDIEVELIVETLSLETVGKPVGKNRLEILQIHFGKNENLMRRFAKKNKQKAFR
jgi:hypothetical protein